MEPKALDVIRELVARLISKAPDCYEAHRLAEAFRLFEGQRLGKAKCPISKACEPQEPCNDCPLLVPETSPRRRIIKAYLADFTKSRVRPSLRQIIAGTLHTEAELDMLEQERA